jgi:hypothetical protein
MVSVFTVVKKVTEPTNAKHNVGTRKSTKAKDPKDIRLIGTTKMN